MELQSTFSPTLWRSPWKHDKVSEKAIKAIAGNADVNDEELMTIFTGAESLLNSRPLTYQTSNPEGETP